MSFLNADQYASVTTRLLDVMDTVMPRRHQIVAAVIVAFITLASVASSLSSRPTSTIAQPLAPIVLIATPTARPAGARGLAKAAAPQSAISVLAAPTAAPRATVAPERVQVVVQSARRVGERRSDKAPPR